MLDIFDVQAESQGIKLLFEIKRFLYSPLRQGDRSEQEVSELLKQSKPANHSEDSNFVFPWLMGD